MHYAQRFSQRRSKSNWSAVNVKRFKELLALGVVHASGVAAFEQRDKAISEDVQAEFTDDYIRIFRQAPDAWAFFQQQPPGYRRQASWYVISARTEPTRAKRLHRVIALSNARRRLPGY
jgi:uncharacterized protein YdeI (YjbR/CyaY-like superfamily)